MAKASGTTDIKIEALTEVSQRVVDELNVLVGQMSRSPRLMDVTYLERLLASPSTFFVARDGGKIVGCAVVVTVILPSKVKAWIEDVVVDQGYRGWGLGRRLLEKAIDHSRQDGCTHVNLTSGGDREAANRLYASLGFYKRDTNVYRLDLR